MSPVHWRRSARTLAATLTESGTLRDPVLREAVETTPRHVFVPRFHTQRPTGEWAVTDEKSPAWLDEVYRDQPLVTALADGLPVSSSTKPGLMVRMIEALRLEPAHRVLEIGTGTGYNAALLTRMLGDDHVASIDIGTDFVAAARDRLAGLGLAPTLAVADGAGGLPDRAPYDRIIATCSVPAVPWAWAGQVRDGGLVLVDLKPSVSAGNLVVLRRYGDRLEGRFLPRWAGFMAMRDPSTPASVPPVAHGPEGPRRTTRLPAEVTAELVPWFLAHCRLPRITGIGHSGRDEDRPEWMVLHAADGSWAEVAVRASDGERAVRQGGPVRLWDHIEAVVDGWHRLGSPGWDRLGLTVTPDGFHRVWLDEPDGKYRWALPPRAVT
ncbi:protein-L-isoaspartate carboxylmethyltransferase [Amycolatopsis antarctica]|uniref:Protein-L-isoaspartate O-methyltransferase n=1 Tax=Amycolatopsis antarctica TaxID=1854586 RepID=A0A263D0U5_9PSEU|nr:methyltransferase domain-containing protein [Amycolatopsis antarctica]OZM71971.1 protein-L-isoaspartate carboxylmethyltransferase [Amycolatopsis antarctica]